MKLILICLVILTMDKALAGVTAIPKEDTPDISGLSRAEQIKITKEVNRKAKEKYKHLKHNCDQHEHDQNGDVRADGN